LGMDLLGPKAGLNDAREERETVHWVWTYRAPKPV
jgi:hypothetical protein